MIPRERSIKERDIEVKDDNIDEIEATTYDELSKIEDETIEEDENAIVDTIYKLSHIRDIDGEDTPSYCFVHDITDTFGLSEDEAVGIAKDNGYVVYEILPNGDVDSGLVIADRDCSKDLISTDYEKFFGVEIEIKPYGEEVEDKVEVEETPDEIEVEKEVEVKDEPVEEALDNIKNNDTWEESLKEDKGSFDLVKEITTDPDAEKYIAQNGKTCYRVFGTLNWYFYKCEQAGIKPVQEDDFLYTAKGNGYEFDWVEEDCILALDKPLKESKKLNEMHSVQDYKGYELDFNEDSIHDMLELGLSNYVDKDLIEITKDGKHIAWAKSYSDARKIVDEKTKEDEVQKPEEHPITVIFRTLGNYKVGEIKNTLRSYQKAVGGYIDAFAFPGRDDIDIVHREYGDKKNEALVIVGLNKDTNCWCSLTQEQIDYVMNYVKNNVLESYGDNVLHIGLPVTMNGDKLKKFNTKSGMDRYKNSNNGYRFQYYKVPKDEFKYAKKETKDDEQAFFKLQDSGRAVEEEKKNNE